MQQKTIILVVVLFALLIAGMFTFAFLKKAELETPQVVPETEVENQDVAYPNIERITATHYFIDGTHTLVGMVPFPTPCELLETVAVVQESFPEQIVINFSVINNSTDCEALPTEQRFQISADASAEATFTATFMGRPVLLNLIPAPEGETPEDFELFLKG